MTDFTDFDQLFAELESFSPVIEDADLSEIPHVSSSPDSFILPSNLPSVSSSKLRFVSQNAMKSNALMHSLLYLLLPLLPLTLFFFRNPGTDASV